jgi:hypothetical protein
MNAAPIPPGAEAGWTPLSLGELCAIAFIVVNLTLAAVWLWREWTSPRGPSSRRRRRLEE